MDHLGNFVIVWDSQGQDGDKSGVYGQRYDASGAALGLEFRVNTATAGSQFDPAIAMTPGGDFVVAWSSMTAVSSGYDYEIYSQRFDASGQPAGL